MAPSGLRWGQVLKDATCNGLEANVVTYGKRISVLEKLGRWQQALGCLKMMRHTVLESNIITCSAASSSCEKGQQWSGAVGLLNDMQVNEISADMISFNATISSLEKGSSDLFRSHIIGIDIYV